MKKILNTFIMLLICIMIVPITAKAETVSDKFTDIPADTWYTSSVQYVYDQGYMSGKSATWFDAAGTLTRAEFVTTLYSIAGKPEVNDVENQFTDVANDWYTNSVLWASSTGCVSGYGDGRFGVNDNITREQLALILYKNGKDAAPEIDEEILNGFHDTASISSYATEALKWAVTNGIMSGTADGNLNPQGNATRAECAVMLCKYCGLLDSQQINYAINGLTVDGTKVTVTVTTQDACTLSVAILNENDETVLITGEVDVAEGLEMGTATVMLPDTPPEYFLAQAVLRDGDGNAVSNTYTSLQYTSAYEEFIAQTPEDFPDNVVQDFGESGFGVMVDHAIVVESPATASGENEYTFAAAEAPQVGDVLLLTESDSVQVPVKVKSVIDNGDGTVTIVEDEDAMFSDFYQVLKLDTVIDVGTVAQQDEPEVLLAKDDDESEQKSVEISGDLTVGPLTVKASGSIGLTVKFAYDAKLFGKDYFEYENYMDIKGTATATLSAGIDSDTVEDILGEPVEILLYDGPVSIPDLGLVEIPLKVSIPLEFKIEGSGSAKIEISAKFGYTCNSRDGYQPLQRNDTTAEFELKAGFEFKTGPKVSLSIELGDDMFEAGVSGQIGIKAEGKTSKKWESEDAKDKIHACDLCADITLTLFTDLKGEIKYELGEFLKGTLAEVDILSGEWELGEAFCSIENEEASLYGGEITFGMGDCYNYKYLVTVTTQDQAGDKVADLPVKVKDGVLDVGNGVSPYKIFLYTGSYLASAEFESGTFNQNFVVDGEPATVVVCEKETKLTGTVTAVLTGEAVEGAKVTLSLTDGTTWTTATNVVGGYAFSGLTPGKYEVQITADSYRPWTKSEVVIEAGPSNTQDAQLKPEYYTVSFAANGGSGTMSPVKVRYDEALVLPECTFTAPEGKIFKAWSVGASEYKAGEEYSPVTADMTAGAVWKEDEVYYTITFDANGGSGTISPVEVKSDEALVLPECTFTPPEGKTFKAWSIAGGEYKAGEEYSPVTADMAVVAVWKEDEVYYTVTFDANGGSGSIPSVKVKSDEALVLPECTFTPPEGKTFKAWSIAGVEYKAGEEYSPVTADMVVAAVWKDSDVAYVTVTVLNPDGSVASGVEIDGTGHDKLPITGDDGSVTFKVWKGCHIFSVSFSNYYAIKVVEVDSEMQVMLTLEEVYIDWSYDEATGTLTVRGNGPMPDYGDYKSENSPPWYYADIDVQNIEIQGVTTIGSYAFSYVGAVENIIIPDGVTVIRNHAFAGLQSLKSVTIPDSVAAIEYGAFENCYQLRSVTIPEGVTVIDTAVFRNCSNLTSVTIPDGVTKIAGSSFEKCKSLTNVILPDSLTSIGQKAFASSGLGNVTMPNSVTYIGYEAFYNLPNIMLYYQGTEEQWNAISKSSYGNIPASRIIFCQND